MGLDEEVLAIGERLRKIRRRRGLGLTVAAGLAGISKPYLSMLERGERGSTDAAYSKTSPQQWAAQWPT